MQQQVNQLIMQVAAGAFGGQHLKEQKQQTEEQKKQTALQAKEAELWRKYRERAVERARKDFSKTMVKDVSDAMFSDPETKKRIDDLMSAFGEKITNPKGTGGK